jgi:ferredoxin
MTERLHAVDPEKCNGDGLCAAVCPKDVLAVVDGRAATVEGRAGSCILCGQCVAVCPAGALRMPKLPMEDFPDLPKPPFGHGELLDFLRRRRSVRAFQDRPVGRELAGKILEAAATAPMGFPPHSTAVLVVDRREELEFLLKEIVKDYDALVKAFSNPIGRAMVRLAAGADSYRALKDHIVDLVRYDNDMYRRDGSDRYLYGAPMLMLFHGDRRALSYEENAHLVCHHAMLAAVALGLGTTVIGLIPPVVDRSKVLRTRWNIPKENRVITSLILGYPGHKYRRSIRRELAGVRYA